MTESTPEAISGLPPAGWYPDPEGAGQRWWDGGAWTEHLHPVGSATEFDGGGRRLPPTRTLVLLAILVVVAIAGAVALFSGSGEDSGGAESATPSASTTKPPGPNDAEMKAIEQRSESLAQERVHTAMIALETFAAQNGGAYLGATPAALQQIEPTLPPSLELEDVTSKGFTVRVRSETGDNWFAVEKDGGAPAYSCGVPGQGSCPASGTWG